MLIINTVINLKLIISYVDGNISNLQGRSRDTDVENGCVDGIGGGRGEWDKIRE